MAKKTTTKKTPVKKPAAKKPVPKKKVVSKPVKTTRRSLKLSRPSLRRVKKPQITFAQTMGLLVSGTVIILGISVGVWWNSIVMDPDRAMSDMLKKSLQTSSVTRTVQQQDQSGDVNQVVRMAFVPSAAARTVTTVKQADPAGQTNTVVTEAIGTPKLDFVRYTSVETPGQQANFENILNVWGRRDVVTAEGGASGFLNEAAIGIVPMGNLAPADRGAVLAVLESKQVFSKYDSVRRETRDGRSVFVYQVSIQLPDLVEGLAAFAKASGLGDASQLDPAVYATAEPLNLEITIDILSRQLRTISYTDSGRVEDYSGYGLKNAVIEPGQSITLDELQGRIQAIQ